ncbi:MAG TPA: helix-turn-helix domain-containing protein [Neobacillus sp.]
MLRNLLPLYENSLLFPTLPSKPSNQHYIFFDDVENEWVGIPKDKISEGELSLLKTLYQQIDLQSISVSTGSTSWFEFLLKDGKPLSYDSNTNFRFIQFYLRDAAMIDQVEIESALKGFFTEEVIIIWENTNRGIVIEEMKQISLSEKELISMSQTLESDFYVNISFYIGKQFPFSEKLPALFQREKEYFAFGQKNLTQTRILTFERVFPAYVAYYLPEELIQKLNNEVADVFYDDPEMFSTIKAFLENNLNASLTAKKLYIHRNTLQYRLDKFVDKTGIGLKDFYGAFTVFLACLLFEHDKKK